MLVDRFAEYSKEIVRAVVEHHERLDGSGYPRGLAGDAMSPLGRVLALAEVVTAMFDGARRLPEQRVSLLLRIDPRRYDPAHVAAVHRLLDVAAEAADLEGIGAEALVARLLQLIDVLALWRASSEAIRRDLDRDRAALIGSIDAQNATLQRMLYDAGVTREQLNALADDIAADGALRVELWALAEELLWQLHAAANQLKRRWRGSGADVAHPAPLAAWFTAVAALDTGRARAANEPARPGPQSRHHNVAMDAIGSLLDFVFHIDAHLATFVRAYGAWVYALLFAIIFVETGVVVMPFLPGDSLLFVVGAMCAVGLMSLPVVLLLLWIAAVLGNQSNYTIGRAVGPRVFSWEDSRWFNKRAFDQAHAFYERYGGITIVAARFMPFLRTFAPFVAGVAQMTRSRFTLYDVTGGALWIGSVTLAGYLFGNIPWVKEHLDKIIWGAILIPGLLVIAGTWRSRMKQAKAA